MKQRDLVIGIGLIIIGLLFLVGPALNLAQVGWPFFIIVPGAALLFFAFSMPATNSALAIPGSILTTIGLILLVFSFNNHWQGWAYAWTLILAASGVGTYLQGTLTDNAKLRSAGTRAALFGGIGFVVLALFFELLIFNSTSAFVRWLIPLGLIIAGAIMLYLNSRNRARPAPAAHTATPPAVHPPVVPPPPPATPPTSAAHGAPTTRPVPPRNEQEHG